MQNIQSKFVGQDIINVNHIYIYDTNIQYLAHTSLCSCTKFLCVLDVGQGNPKHKYCVGRELIKGSL